MIVVHQGVDREKLVREQSPGISAALASAIALYPRTSDLGAVIHASSRSLHHSPEMREYFGLVKRILVEHHEMDRHSADVLVDRYFALDVDPLERSLVMHRNPQEVAEDLAKGSR